MPVRTVALLLGLALLGGCASSYVYSGTFDARDSFGNDRQFQVYWRKTEYAFLYGVANDPITLRTECSLNTVLFEDSDDGIVFRRRPTDQPAIDPPSGGDGPICGRVIGVDRIKDIPDGAEALSIETWCRPASNRPLRAYIQAREDPCVVDISRVETDEYPQPPDCRPGG